MCTSVGTQFTTSLCKTCFEICQIIFKFELTQCHWDTTPRSLYSAIITFILIKPYLDHVTILNYRNNT